MGTPKLASACVMVDAIVGALGHLGKRVLAGLLQRDRLHAVLCAAGYNLRWLLRMIAKKGVPFLRRLYLRLCQAADLSPNRACMLRILAVHAFRKPVPRLAAS